MVTGDRIRADYGCDAGVNNLMTAVVRRRFGVLAVNHFL